MSVVLQAIFLAVFAHLYNPQETHSHKVDIYRYIDSTAPPKTISYTSLVRAPFPSRTVQQGTQPWEMSIISSEVVRGGDFADITRTIKFYDSPDCRHEVERFGGWSRSIWSPLGQLLLVARDPSDLQFGTLHEVPSMAMIDMLSSPESGATLDGMVYGWNGRTIQEAFHACPQDKLEIAIKENGAIHIACSRPDGTIEAIFSSGAEKELQYFKVTWESHHTFRGEVLSKLGLEWVELEVINRDYKVIQQRRIPTRGEVRLSHKDNLGGYERREYFIQRSNIDVHPSVTRLESGILPIAEGLPIRASSRPHVLLEWRGGHLVSRLNKEAFHRIDDLINSIKSQNGSNASADTKQRAQLTNEDRTGGALVSSSQCGVMCAYAFARLQDRNVDIDVLASGKFIGGASGSTLDEVAEAVRSSDLTASPQYDIPTNALFDGCHRILLVKNSRDAFRPDHYVLSTGVVGGLLQILDPGGDEPSLRLWTIEMLNERWSGSAVVSSGAELGVLGRATNALTGARATSVIILGVLGVAVFLLSTNRITYNSRLSKIVYECCLVFVVSIGAAITHHFVVLNNRSPLVYGTVANSPFAVHLRPIPEISIENALEIAAHPNVHFVDARYRRDFARDHIRNAVSIPIGSTDRELERKVTGFDRDDIVVVYCQSSGCLFADSIATRLRRRGFLSVLHMKAGIEGWNSTASPKPSGIDPMEKL